MIDDNQKINDEEIHRLDDELQELIDEEDDQEITDEELQRLIDINEADSLEPAGISPQRRKKLIKDTEDRIASLKNVFKPGDFIMDYWQKRRDALLRGDSAEEIDALTVEFAEQNEINLDVFFEDWVGTEQLKLKQISRIEDEDEREAALEALATESVLREDQQKALRPARKFTDEWYELQRWLAYQDRWKYRWYTIKKPLLTTLFLIAVIGGAILADLLLIYIFGVDEDKATSLLTIIIVIVVISYSIGKRRYKKSKT